MKLEILVGMIASGKSTYAALRAREGAIIINDDAIQYDVHGGHYDLYDERLKPLYKTVGTAILFQAAALGKDVVVDTTAMSRKRRRRWIGLGHSFDYFVSVRQFPVGSPEEHAQRRYQSNNRGLSFETWLKVAQRHAQIYEPPHRTEGMDEIIIV
jgi:predicted kinase